MWCRLGIAEPVGAKNVPPAHFLHAPTHRLATNEAQKRIGGEVVEIIKNF